MTLSKNALRFLYIYIIFYYLLKDLSQINFKVQNYSVALGKDYYIQKHNFIWIYFKYGVYSSIDLIFYAKLLAKNGKLLN